MGLQSPRIDFLGPTHAWVWPEREFPKNVSGRKEQAMSFVDKVDKIEKMEQQMWKSAGETIREKKKRVKRDLSPKNYKWGVCWGCLCIS